MNSRPDFTFKHNVKNGRHGWLRLTPAYSIKLVHEILDRYPGVHYVLDPFAGTGTTGLVCAERGLSCDLLDINPFLVWFCRVKTANYSFPELEKAKACLNRITNRVQENSQEHLWIPPIKNVGRWWSIERLKLLARIYEGINNTCAQASGERDLLLIAFCRTLIQWSNVAFNHQSMSFKGQGQKMLFEYSEADWLLDDFSKTATAIVETAKEAIPGQVNVIHADSRHVPQPSAGQYDCVITSPPYPNRMSYIRELRPYMYWLGYLNQPREAGELDWQAIGGTWGIATSRVGKWQPNGPLIEYSGFLDMIRDIGKRSQVLGNYVHKYFADINLHIHSLFPNVTTGGKVFYIVGNSKFYETVVPVEKVYASILQNAGFVKTEIVPLRKRNSKKELYEFMVSAEKP